MKTIKDVTSGKNKIYIAGGGQYGETVARYLEKKGIGYAGVVDKKEKEFMGMTTVTYDKLDKTGDYIVASLDYDYGIEIKNELLSRGVNVDNLYSIDKLEIMQEIFDVLYDYPQKFSPQIKALKNKYKGETCFIVGNGPSLRIEDLDKLIGKYCLAANGIYKMFPHTGWRPQFYFSQDDLMVQNILLKDIDRIADLEFIFTSINSKMIGFKEKHDNIRYMRLYYEEDNFGLPKFSTDCEKVVNLSRTVSYSMLQMAAFMGFKTIYLLGMDCSFEYELLEDGRIVCHDVKDYGEIIGELFREIPRDMTRGGASEKYQQIKGFKAAKKFAESNNIHIYNATRGGELDVFERVDFDKLF